MYYKRCLPLALSVGLHDPVVRMQKIKFIQTLQNLLHKIWVIFLYLQLANSCPKTSSLPVSLTLTGGMALYFFSVGRSSCPNQSMEKVVYLKELLFLLLCFAKEWSKELTLFNIILGLWTFLKFLTNFSCLDQNLSFLCLLMLQFEDLQNMQKGRMGLKMGVLTAGHTHTICSRYSFPRPDTLTFWYILK